ncbi:MAG: DUF5668 domain-containing protein [Acidobacteria bacterium]|nr:DUF5668 domain-containing protein [Acidobacteriota bacterium]
MNSNLFRAVRGPLLLIAVGVLFAMDQAGTVRIGQSWPALLVVVGLLKLMEQLTAAPPAAGGN